MKVVASLLLMSLAFNASAQVKHSFAGSDTMGGIMTDAIIAAGMTEKIAYTGGGSGVGEKALVNGEVGISAMSRALKPEAVTAIQTRGGKINEYVIALDGLGIFVNAANATTNIDLQTIVKIFTCEIVAWNQVPGSTQTGKINAYRRNDLSGTTDTFKSLTGLKKFGDCVTVMNETADIAERTATEASAIGFSGLSATKEGNKTLSIALKAGGAYVAPLTSTIRNGTYPLARSLFIYEVVDQTHPLEVEKELLEYVLDRSFMDPIVQDHDFITLD